jgi:hypothetical protein
VIVEVIVGVIVVEGAVVVDVVVVVINRNGGNDNISCLQRFLLDV